MKHTLVTFLTLATFNLYGQLAKPEQSIDGSLYVSVDDVATIYLNGKQLIAAEKGEHATNQFKLSEGDHIVAVVEDYGGDRRFFIAFKSSDGKQLVNFTPIDFKIVPDLLTDFSPSQFESWKKHPKLQQNISNPLPFKSYSRPFWGEMNKFIVACIVDSKMFSKAPQ
jgi:hypothetical protein